MKKHLGLAAVLGVGLTVAISAPAHAADTTIHVPDDFLPKPISDTRATGHYEVEGTALRIWTEGNTSTDKVAEYVATSVPLGEVGDPQLVYTTNAGTIAPGFQLIIDVDGDGLGDGILVGESVYGENWWLNNGADAEVKAVAPHTGGGFGSAWYGTLAEWDVALEDAVVVAFGFSLGSSVLGDYTLESIQFAGDSYTFANSVTLTAKDECKNGGWATSTKPVFKNQGECVSSFVSAKSANRTLVK